VTVETMSAYGVHGLLCLIVITLCTVIVIIRKDSRADLKAARKEEAAARDESAAVAKDLMVAVTHLKVLSDRQEMRNERNN